jgi:dienelactone hydrolase
VKARRRGAGGRIAIVILAGALRHAGTGGATVPPLAVHPGPHAVGFRTAERADASRRTPDGTVWRVHVAVWYPAQAGGPALAYRDYVLEGERAGSQAAEGETIGRYVAFLERNGVPRPGIDAWLASPMLAVRDAAPREGRFPVVLLAQGMGGSVQDQAVLAEHLASHGFVVATTPSPVRSGLPMESEADVPVMARAQARDLAVALDELGGWPVADRDRVAVAGYSFGARSALLFAGRHPGTRALVSFDGGIASADAKGWLAPGDLDREAFRAPLLHLGHDTKAADAPPLDRDLLDSLRRSPRTVVEVDGLAHLDLISFGAARGRIGALEAAAQRDRLAERVSGVMDVARAFLEAHAGGDRRAWDAFVADPVAAGHRRGLFTIATLAPAP